MAALTGLVLTLDGSIQRLSTALAAVLTAGCPYVNSVQLQAAAANTATTFVGGSTVTDATDAIAIIPAGSAMTFSGGNRSYVDVGSIYVKGTNGHKLHIAIIN
jgi:hypothetical protein